MLPNFLLMLSQTNGEFECAASYFGPRRIRGKKGCGAIEKILYWVF